MRILGIIAEYNPFHNGHLYHLEQSKKQLNNDYTVCIMSGNFIQRGLPALYNKWLRSEIALKSGIDLVIELPTYYAINSADFFSQYSINIFNKIGITDISFGVETNNIKLLNDIANILVTEPEEYKKILKEELDKGELFAKANETAVLKILNNDKYTNILNSSNNILAIEYLKALQKSESNIKPLLIQRKSNNYSDLNIDNNICSATAIRNALENNENITHTIPNTTNEYINSVAPTFLKDFENEILYRIRTMNTKELNDILEITEGIDNRLKTYCYDTNNIYEYIELIKTKRFTQSKIQRILIHILLNMTKSEFKNIQSNNYEYIRILGFNTKGEELLKIISTHSTIPIITSVNKYLKENNNPLLGKDILASNIYCKKNNIDLTQKIIKME